MSRTLEQALVRTILEHAADYPWRIQDTGALALRLDDRREYRLHVWDPEGATGDPPVHDHPFDFTSTVIVGELVNTRYVEDPSGAEYVHERYSPGSEDDRRGDTIRLVGTSATLRAGSQYRQSANELHDSRQIPGTVTALRFQHTGSDRPELTVCRRPGTAWVSGQARGYPRRGEAHHRCCPCAVRRTSAKRESSTPTEPLTGTSLLAEG